jgi:pectate lyase
MRIRVQTVHQLALSAIIIAVLFTVGGLHPHVGHAEVKAFPTAEGFGANSVGGRGGRVIKVTNLNDSGAGSLRACMQNTGARTCVFTVGGTITLNSDIVVTGASMSYLTVAGQTAPGGGIQLRGNGVKFTAGVHDIIMRHLRIRGGPGPDLYQTGFNILVYEASGGAPYNIIFDHMTLQWGAYLQLEFSGVRNWTTQWSLIGPSMNSLDYIDAQGDPAGGMGMAVGSYDDFHETGTLHHNLFIDNEVRQPLIGSGEPIDMVNNIMFNWYGCTYGSRFKERNDEIHGRVLQLNLVNNIWLSGPATCDSNTIGTSDGDGSTNFPFPRIYASGNQAPRCGGPSCNNPTLSGLGLVGSDRWGNPPISDADFRVYTPHSAPPVTTTPTNSLESTLVANVGATKPSRDSLDTLYLQQFQARQGGCGSAVGCRQGQPYPTLANGSAPTDTDNDGIPDSWENTHGLNPNSAADGALKAQNGYTNLENYLNELAGDGGTSSPLATPANLIRVEAVTP